MIIIKTNKEIEVMRHGGKILAGILKKIIAEVRPEVTTAYLEEMACDLIKAAGARPSFKGYQTMHNIHPFPTALCTSINNEIVHAPALPSRVLKSGDIIGVDLGIEYPYGKGARGYYTDMAATVSVGNIDKQAGKLINTAKKSLEIAIKQVKPGNSLNDIGQAVQALVESKGFSVVRDLVGHGVGTAVHEEPQVPNFKISGSNLDNVFLKKGMTLAIEPMVCAGGWKVKNGGDGFTIETADRSLSAHFEHTVAVTEKGNEILTAL